MIDKILPDVCKADPSLCAFDVDIVCGPTTFLNESRTSFYLHYEPNPTSVKNMAQWSQVRPALPCARLSHCVA